MKRTLFSVIITLFLCSNAHALPIVTFLEDQITMQVKATYQNAPGEYPPALPHGTILYDEYIGAMVTPSDSWLTINVTSNSASSSAHSICNVHDDDIYLDSYVNLDDDIPWYFEPIDGITAYATSQYESIFTVNGDGAGIESGIITSGSVHLYDLTLGTEIAITSGLLLDGHTYKFTGETSQCQGTGCPGGADDMTGYYLWITDAIVKVPEASSILLMVSGLLLMFVRRKVA